MCVEPKKLFVLGKKENGKLDTIITNRNVHHIDVLHNGGYELSYTEGCSDRAIRPITDYVYIPCKHCIECRLDYAKTWAQRCLMESLYHTHNYFITCTYDDDHLHKINGYNSVCKKDFQSFVKSLRNRGFSFRYFGCTEYGSKSYRPHAHLIVFGLDIPDLKFESKNFRGDNYYSSKLLEECWSKGFVTVADCTFNSCCYVARYVQKKYDDNNKILDDFINNNGLEKEKLYMSRRPGIGYQYYYDHYDEFNSLQYLTIPDHGKVIRVYKNQYFKKLDDEVSYNKKLEAIRDSQFKRNQDKLSIYLNSDYTFEEYLNVKKDNLIAKTKSLERSI